MESWCKNLGLLVKSRTPLIWITTKEEERLQNVLEETFKKLKIKRFVSWDYINGLRGVISEEGKFTNNPLGILNWLNEQNNESSTILLVKDFSKFYDDPSICRTIKELSYYLRTTSNNLIFSSHKLPTSDELEDLMTILNLPLPNQKELTNILKKSQ